ncbi:hypothetical protein ACLOJK_027091 [Asimina triloba]
MPNPIISLLQVISSYSVLDGVQPILKAASLQELFFFNYRTARGRPCITCDEKRFVSFEDLTMIRDYYSVLSNIILSALEPYETPRDYHPGHIYLYEFLLRAGFGDVKTIKNSPDPTLGWKSRFFFARLVSERDVWGVPDQWVQPLLEPISMLTAGLVAS